MTAPRRRGEVGRTHECFAFAWTWRRARRWQGGGGGRTSTRASFAVMARERSDEAIQTGLRQPRRDGFVATLTAAPTTPSWLRSSRRGPRRRDAVKRLRRSSATLRSLRDDCVSSARRSGLHILLVRDAAKRPRSLTIRIWRQTAIGGRGGQGRRSGSHGRMLRIRLDLTASTAMAARGGGGAVVLLRLRPCARGSGGL